RAGVHDVQGGRRRPRRLCPQVVFWLFGRNGNAGQGKADVGDRYPNALKPARRWRAPACTRHRTGIRTRRGAADAAAERDQKLEYLYRGQGAQGELMRCEQADTTSVKRMLAI